MFQNIRLSKHFVLLDFMNDLEVYSSRMCVTPGLASPDVIDAGRGLCTHLLEPLIERFGPVSVSSGWRPEAILQRQGFQTPHRWGDPAGGAAAADIVLHDWVNDERPPIHGCILWLEEDRLFNRFITYAGSEFFCASIVPVGYNRHAVYENVLTPMDYKARHIVWTNKKADRADLPHPFPSRRRWRREPGSGPQAYKQELQAQHVRVGRYFVLLDFCRSEVGLAEGFRWVPPLGMLTKQIEYARMAAEILDPLVARVGRLSVTKGFLPRTLAQLEDDPWLHRWVDGSAGVEFLLPVGTSDLDALPALCHSAIINTSYSSHASGTIRMLVTFNPFEPATRWTSARHEVRPPRVRVRST